MAGAAEVVSEWLEITQERVNGFADATRIISGFTLTPSARSKARSGPRSLTASLRCRSFHLTEDVGTNRRNRHGHQLRTQQGEVHASGTCGRPDSRAIDHRFSRACRPGRSHHLEHHHRDRWRAKTCSRGRDRRTARQHRSIRQNDCLTHLNVPGAPLRRSLDRRRSPSIAHKAFSPAVRIWCIIQIIIFDEE